MTPIQTLLAQIRKPEFLEAVRGAVPNLSANSDTLLSSEVLMVVCSMLERRDRQSPQERAAMWSDIRGAIVDRDFTRPTDRVPRYGFYSHQQAQKYGSVFYSQGDGEVEVSSVGLDPECSGCSWPDKALVGEVGKFLRNGRPGILVTPPFPFPPFPSTTPPFKPGDNEQPPYYV